MPRRLLPAALVALALAFVLASCGGGGSTTVSGKAAGGNAMTRKVGQQPLKTYLPDATTGRHLVKPTTYRFPGDGDVTAKGLRWHGWGNATATASGTIAEHPANGLVDTFSGSVTASAQRRCKGAAYYTEVMAHVPKQADFVPTHPTKLTTPCA